MVSVPPVRGAWRGLAVAATAALVVGVAVPASAHNGPAPRITEIDQVSNQPRKAKIMDGSLVNAWGLALSPTSPLWSANNGSDTATLYAGGLGGAAVTKPTLTVTVPGGPTGQVFNSSTSSTDFVVTGPTGSGAARFIFSTESGDILGWNSTANATVAIRGTHVDGAIFKSLAIANTTFGSFLLAADFHNARIDVFDGQFRQIPLPPEFFFHDPKLPKGYAPFNVAVSGDKVYVTYAKQDADAVDELHGDGLGFVDVYTNFGVTVQRIASRGPLNAPWGLAFAPAGWGSLAGDLLVGNFGDGRINAYDGDHFDGQLRGTDGRPLNIDGLWALLPGTASTGGVDTVWFSAGPNDESNGLVGQLTPAA